MFEFYIADIYTGEEDCIIGSDFETACFENGYDPYDVELINMQPIF